MLRVAVRNVPSSNVVQAVTLAILLGAGSGVPAVVLLGGHVASGSKIQLHKMCLLWAEARPISFYEIRYD